MTGAPFPHREIHGGWRFLRVHTRSAQRLHLTACGLDIAGKAPRDRFKGYRAPSLTDVATLRALGVGAACSVCLNKVGAK